MQVLRERRGGTESDGADRAPTGLFMACPAHPERVDCGHVSPMASRGPLGPMTDATSCSTAGSQPTTWPDREGGCSTPGIESVDATGGSL